MHSMRSHGAESVERGDDGNSTATAATILPTSPSSLTTLTLAVAKKLRVDGVTRPVRPAGQAAWTDGAVVDGSHMWYHGKRRALTTIHDSMATQNPDNTSMYSSTCNIYVKWPELQ